MQSTKKWIQISYLVLAFITGIFFYYLSDTIWDIARLPLPLDWFISPAQIIAFVTAAALFVFLQKNVKVNQFSNEVASELVKVTWPERKETLLSTGVITVMISICAVILFTFDSIWGTVVRIIYD